MQFELVNYKGVIKILVGLLLAKLWVDLSTDICIALIDTCTDIASSVFTSADEMIVFPSFDTLIRDYGLSANCLISYWILYCLLQL